ALKGPTIVLARPNSGKTRMLTHRLAHLVVDCGGPAAPCLAVTFTSRATEEWQQRLHPLLPSRCGWCPGHGSHALPLFIVRAPSLELGRAPDFGIGGEGERAAALAVALSVSETKAARVLRAISALKRTSAAADGELGAALDAYRLLGREQNWIDFDDLVGLS